MKVAIQTLFLPRESLPYMEEWLLYHTLVGFDRFVLYDNTGSKGDASSPYLARYGGTLSKYGLPIIPRETSDDRLAKATRAICSRFNVDIVPWPSPHFSQEVLMRSIHHHSERDGSDYTAFIDMDEYVCLGRHGSIGEFIAEEVEGTGHVGVRISQQKMAHILKEKLTTKRMVWEMTETFEMETRGWAPKNILPTGAPKLGQDIHNLTCDGPIRDQPDRSLIKVNHYNTNEYQMRWLLANRLAFDRNTPPERLYLGQSHDHSLEPFREEMSKWDYVRWEDT